MNGFEDVLKEKEKFEKQYIPWRQKKKTTWNPNDILIFPDHAEIILRNNKQKITGITLIDLEDVERVKNLKWTNDGKDYARTNTKGPYQGWRLHRFLLSGDNSGNIDHINRNPLDNRKKNLRITTIDEQRKNKTRVYLRNPRILQI